MNNLQIKRKFIRKKTKKAIKRVLKELLVKGYVYSYKEAQRLGLEYREFREYIEPLTIKRTAINIDGNDRNYFQLNKETKILLETRIKDLIVFENEKLIKLIKILFC